MGLSNRRMVEWWNGGVVELSDLESSNGGVVELSNRRMGNEETVSRRHRVESLNSDGNAFFYHYSQSKVGGPQGGRHFIGGPMHGRIKQNQDNLGQTVEC